MPSSRCGFHDCCDKLPEVVIALSTRQDRIICPILSIRSSVSWIVISVLYSFSVQVGLSYVVT